MTTEAQLREQVRQWWIDFGLGADDVMFRCWLAAHAAGYKAGMEKAASICAARAYDYGRPSFRFDEALDCAAVIRAELAK